MKSIKKIFVVLAVAMLMFSMVLATSYAIIIPKENENYGITIDSKTKKVINFKVTWSANGGKISGKNTKIAPVKKGSKIGKLPATPKRSAYEFMGWYTKKSGGKKITKNTKPTKTVTYFAQWKKVRVLTAEEKKLVGSYTYSTFSYGYWTYNSYNTDKWKDGSGFAESYLFKSDGTFEKIQLSVGSIYTRGGALFKRTGNWHIPVKGTISFTNQILSGTYVDGTLLNGEKLPNRSYDYEITEKDGKKGIIGFDVSPWFFRKD